MNQHGWTYKKLEDTCNIDYGTRVVQKKDKGTTYYVYGGGGATFMVDMYNREDCFIISRFAMSPKCTRFVKGKFFLNDSGLSVSTNNASLSQRFLDKVLLANNDNIYLMGKGLAQRNLDMPSFKKLIIPIPPIEEQERIVGELDLISSIIEKKKAQLNEYDRLAQSIFYSMFGDPITNEKGWERDELQSIYKVTSSKRVLQTEWQNNGVPFYKVADIVSLINGNSINPSTFIKESTYDGLQKANLVPKAGDILVTSRGTLGLCYIIKENDKFYFQDGMITWLSQKEKKVFPEYIKAVFASNSFSESLLRSANSSTVAYISINQLSKRNIPVPPLALQQEFAEKVEAIERQKALVRASIVETETLFNSRMDYYFN
mgnify:CR=1 FL=1